MLEDDRKDFYNKSSARIMLSDVSQSAIYPQPRVGPTHSTPPVSNNFRSNPISFDVKDEGPGVDQIDLQGIATILDVLQFAKLQKVVVHSIRKTFSAFLCVRA